MNNPSHNNGRLLRFLALGDSYTIGEGVPEADRWPAQLVERLRRIGLAVADAEIIARTGWTTDELAQGINDRQPRGPYDLVSLLIGVNNQYRRRPLDDYADQFRQLLLRASSLAGERFTRVLVVSIPDWGVTSFARAQQRAGISSEIDAFNAANRAAAAQYGARYVDITPISRRAAGDDRLLASDGLHPSGAMYAAWVDLILSTTLSALSDDQQPA